MGSKLLALSFLVVLGCAKGTEIDLQDVVIILPSLPPSAADASVDSGSGAQVNDVSPSALVVTPTPAIVDIADASPDIEALDAAPAALSDSGP